MRKIASVSILVFAGIGLYSCAGARHGPLAAELLAQLQLAGYRLQGQSQ